MKSRIPFLAVAFILVLILTACGAQAAPAAYVPATAARATSVPPTSVPPGAQPPPSGSSGSAAAAAQVALANNSQLGSILVDGKGMTLYLFTKDSPNTTTCYGKCATAWPPLLGSPEAGAGVDSSKLGTITRTDGTTQVTYNGWPLYYYAKDHQPGDVTGQNVGSVWYVLSASGDAIK